MAGLKATLLVGGLMLAAYGFISPPGHAAASDSPPPKAPGYLQGDQVPDVAPLLGPPPADGSGTKAGDVATFRTTRAMQGTARWALAISDANYGAGPIMQDYSCALGVALNQNDAPTLFRLLDRLSTDAGDVERSAKAVFKRPRPFVEIGGPICVAPDQYLAKSYSYPSGHSLYSWAAGLLMSEIAPDRSAAILARARVYGESRVVCGVHYESDVQAGRLAGSALFSALQGDTAFRQDLNAARDEVMKLEAAGLPPPSTQCALEADASAHPIW